MDTCSLARSFFSQMLSGLLQHGRKVVRGVLRCVELCIVVCRITLTYSIVFARVCCSISSCYESLNRENGSGLLFFSFHLFWIATAGANAKKWRHELTLVNFRRFERLTWLLSIIRTIQSIGVEREHGHERQNSLIL